MLKNKFAVLTCGGVCPGMNDVVRSITLRSFGKGVKDVHGIKYGFQGLHNCQKKHVHLTPHLVENIHFRGGSFLGTSRDRLEPAKAITTLRHHGYDTLFVIGGNGGNAAASVLHKSIQTAKLPIQVIALPKSIDNDIDIIDRCFGFDTAVAEASKVVAVARNEADAVPRGVSFVKVMGRQSGFIAYHASGADLRLIPENPLTIEAIVEHVKKRVDDERSSVICVAEGYPVPAEWLVDVVKEQVSDCYVKYFDPGYMIRGGVTTAFDHEYCNMLGEAAVDAALSGHSGITVATKNGKIAYFDTESIVRNVKKCVV